MAETKRRSPILAALASLSMPGLGQLYNGQPLLAAVWFGAYFGLALWYTLRVFELVLSPDPASQLSRPLGLLLLMALVWLAGVVQAVFAALGRQDYELKSYNSALAYLGLYLLAYVGLPLLLAFPVGRWVMARHGVTTPEQRAAVVARLGGLAQSGAMAARAVATPVDLKIDIPDPEAAARTAMTVFHIVLVGGPDGGIYDASSNEPVCSYQTTGAESSWAGLYANPADTAGLTAIQFRVPIEQGETSEFQLSLNRGTGTNTRNYVVDGRRPWGENGKGRATVDRRGHGAVIRVDATTPEGVRVEAVVQCKISA